MNEVSLDKIVNMVVKEILKELEKKNVRIVYSDNSNGLFIQGGIEQSGGFRTKKEKIDMSAYKSPVLTENHIKKLHELTGEIIVPRGTILTPKARQALRSRGIAVVYES